MEGLGPRAYAYGLPILSPTRTLKKGLFSVQKANIQAKNESCSIPVFELHLEGSNSNDSVGRRKFISLTG